MPGRKQSINGYSIIFTMKYDFDHTPERRNSECFKWQTYKSEVIPMFIADMDFPSPQPVIAAKGIGVQPHEGAKGTKEAIVRQRPEVYF